MGHYFPYDVKLRLLAHSRSFLANQKARNAIVGAENLLNCHYSTLNLILIENHPSLIQCFTQTELMLKIPVGIHNCVEIVIVYVVNSRTLFVVDLIHYHKSFTKYLFAVYISLFNFACNDGYQ